MEGVICYCQECRQELGKFRNSWNSIGKTYHSPVYPMLAYTHGFEASGDIFPGAAGTPVGDSFLQDLKCKKCKTLLGFRCDQAPEGHVLAKDQLILRLSSMSVISESTGLNASISVEKKILLAEETPKKSSSRRASTLQPTARGKSEGRHEKSGTQLRTDMRPPPNMEINQSGISSFEKWARNAIESQKNDLDRISETLKSLETEMSSFQIFMKDVRLEMQQSRKARNDFYEDRMVLRKLVQDVSSLESRLKIVGTLTEERSKSGESVRRDIDILISDLQQVMNKAYEVDDVKNGLLQFYNRLASCEESTAQVMAKLPHDLDVSDIKRQLERFQAQIEIFEQSQTNSHPKLPSTTEATEKVVKRRSDVRVPRVEILVPARETPIQHPETSKSQPESSHEEVVPALTAPKRKRAETLIGADEESVGQPQLQRRKTRRSGRGRVEEPAGNSDEIQAEDAPSTAQIVEAPPPMQTALPNSHNQPTTTNDTLNPPAHPQNPPLEQPPQQPAQNPTLLTAPPNRRHSLRNPPTTTTTLTPKPQPPKRPHTAPKPPSHDAILPSIEREDPEPIPRVTRRSEMKTAMEVIDLTTEEVGREKEVAREKETGKGKGKGKKTYQCNTCSSVFAFPGGLAYHKRTAKCSGESAGGGSGSGSKEEEERKRAKLLEREKAVREALERGM
ncbi:hypothetical protein GLAREA_05741 [Glarea lozoyensis ATCC 20868]|uniref:C2H2-type domain-containing protein n=1 Tax=Glarea lozoyensis (strain ATCC 20868 / MF5171) TaxID=1116229 RepID=S3EDP3_GLAL2|nr:uncharacterized protein GLAREA_05741 [Glarea lozoyensis ATCC 20868]EPE36403.1 hypothetical protein GLAREA_05741 [Glarea lozoyensis ATCC 20868]